MNTTFIPVSLTSMQLSTVYRWLEWAGFEHHTFDATHGCEVFFLGTSTHDVYVLVGDVFEMWADNGHVETRYKLWNASDLMDRFAYIGSRAHEKDEARVVLDSSNTFAREQDNTGETRT